MKVNQKRPWETPHGHCHEMWRQHDWQLTLFSNGGEAQERVDEEVSKTDS